MHARTRASGRLCAPAGAGPFSNERAIAGLPVQAFPAGILFSVAVHGPHAVEIDTSSDVTPPAPTYTEPVDHSFDAIQQSIDASNQAMSQAAQASVDATNAAAAIQQNNIISMTCNYSC